MNASRVIDCLVNVHFGETEKQPTWMLKVRDDYFKGPESMFAPVDLSALLEEMDEHGVRKAVLMDNLAKRTGFIFTGFGLVYITRGVSLLRLSACFAESVIGADRTVTLARP